jgi:hypothetical protein
MEHAEGSERVRWGIARSGIESTAQTQRSPQWEQTGG